MTDRSRGLAPMHEADQQTTSPTRRWSRRAVAATSIAIVLVLVSGALSSAAAGGWRDLVQRRPQEFVALSFADSAWRPSYGRPGEEIAVPYRVTDHGVDDSVVKETVSLLELPSLAQVWSLERTAWLLAGSSGTRTVTVRLPQLPDHATAWRVQVRLGSGEEVHRTIWPVL